MCWNSYTRNKNGGSMNKHNPNNENIQFPLTNDLVFSLVMQDTDLCKELIQRIFPERKIAELKFSDTYVESQKSLINGIIEKSVRLDVLFIGDTNGITWNSRPPLTNHFYAWPLLWLFHGHGPDKKG